MRGPFVIGVAVLLLTAAAQAETKKTLSKNDRTEIQELYARYAHAMDGSDKEVLADLFAEDGVFTIDGGRTWNGRQEIASIISRPRRERPKITHFFSNILAQPTPDGARVSHYVILIDLQKN